MKIRIIVAALTFCMFASGCCATRDLSNRSRLLPAEQREKITQALDGYAEKLVVTESRNEYLETTRQFLGYSNQIPRHAMELYHKNLIKRINSGQGASLTPYVVHYGMGLLQERSCSSVKRFSELKRTVNRYRKWTAPYPVMVAAEDTNSAYVITAEEADVAQRAMFSGLLQSVSNSRIPTTRQVFRTLAIAKSCDLQQQESTESNQNVDDLITRSNFCGEHRRAFLQQLGNDSRARSAFDQLMTQLGELPSFSNLSTCLTDLNPDPVA